MLLDGASAERRKSIRFPIAVVVRLKRPGGEITARTVNISSGGALLCASCRLPTGTHVEAHISWPVSLSTCDLKLVITGVVVWSRDEFIAVRRDRYDFKTVAGKHRPSGIPG